MTQSEELLKFKQALAAKASAIIKNSEDDDSGGETGTGITVEKRLFVEMFGLLRNGEKEFGIAHEFDQLAYLAKSDPNRFKGELSQGSGLQQHPILSQLSLFDGNTPDMSLPTENPDAQDRYENRLQLQHGMRNQPKPTLTRG